LQAAEAKKYCDNLLPGFLAGIENMLKQNNNGDGFFIGDQVNNVNAVLSRGWLGSRVVTVLDSGAEGPGFISQPRRCRVTVLGKLFTPIIPTVPLFTKHAATLAAALLRVTRVIAGLAESNGSLPSGL